MQKVLHNTLIPVHRGKQTNDNTEIKLIFKYAFFFFITSEAPQHKESTAFTKYLGR